MQLSTEKELSAFIDRHRVLLAKEREAEIERTSLLLSNCGPKLLEQKGLALIGVGVSSIGVGLGGKTLVELERPAAYHTNPIFPPHTLRPGDLARIEENVAASGASKKGTKAKKSAVESKTSQFVEGVVYKVSDTRIAIAVDASDSSSDDLDLPERCRIVKLANSVTYDRMEKTLDQLEKIAIPTSATGTHSGGGKNQPELTKLTEVLLGMSRPSDRAPVKDLKFFDSSLNDSQKEAIKFALESPELACIHGPPGTGKTHTLIEIIRQLTSTSSYNPKPKRLLVCGASNLSVDNILERLLALPTPENKFEKLKVTRVGHPARVMANNEGVLEATLEVKAGRSDQAALAKDVKNELQAAMDTLSGKGKGAKGKGPRGLERKKMWEEVKALRKEYRQREGGVVQTVLSESQVVLATCHSAGGRQLWNQKFDVVIIDEATQALEAVCWIPIFKASKLILAGDPKQLPPTILSLDKSGKEKKADKKAAATKTTGKAAAKAKVKPSDPKAEVPQSKPQGEDDSASGSDSEGSSEDTDGENELEPASTTPKKDVEVTKDDKNKVKPKKARLRVLRPPRTLETTMFERLEKLYGPGIKRMLTVQYRMHEQIAQFPSQVMYNSKLQAHPSVASHLLCDLSNVNTDGDDNSKDEEDNVDKEVLRTPVVFFDTAGCEYFERTEGDGDEGSKCNENEATVVRKWVEQLVDVGILPSQIAIITPYQAQVTLLTSILRPTYGTDLEIGTVDGMQGREKEAVIISLVRSNEKREVGFLKEKRRLNVAMTRARRHLCIVGDSSTVQHGGSYLKKWLAWLEANADVRFAEID
ncbi:P-loop containing nucleoside triphosphate hydrolase protein [Stereum hirsutum FP-91666 SS1]|uniref:P-loop containing nucleoside triphosphate hydrolase protein n=1 Tax=Stereum hirsutum (strain FP-91666) TaxID=721885 RepID=UPI000440C2FA|nr:P-loop containing nucleoside triphosphate hydrolase protein [Stereum hirsutum FP-91666 SS1]EIM87529.1 P-loop containing nucleoside triphosphate hydrolase protein [Stereum hirsutum FP-91666 SS1]